MVDRIYRVDIEHGWIREVWLVPLDSELFDRTALEPRAGKGHWASAGSPFPHSAYRRMAVAEAADRASCIATT